MRIFKQGNWKDTKATCPICNTQKKGEVVLAAIEGTQKGYNCQAKQVHLECLNLWINEEHGFIYQKIRKQNGTEK